MMSNGVNKKSVNVCEIENYLRESRVWCEVCGYRGLPVVVVSIHWGDWKHEHLRCDWLMEEKFGASRIKVEVTEENGSDCYSADHYYLVEGLNSGYEGKN